MGAARPRLVLALLVLGAAPVRSEDAFQSYKAGLEALQKGDCGKAASLLEAAASKDGKEAERKRTYGMNFEPYYPHFYLGKAYACLGDSARALEALGRSESQGAYKGGEIAALRSQLQAKTPPPATPSPTVDPRVAQGKAAFDAGLAAYQQKSWDRAVASLKEAATLDPANAEAKRYLDLALKEQQKKGSVDKLVAEGQKALERSDAAGARAKADAALKLDPSSAAARALGSKADAALAAAGTPPPATPSLSPAKQKAAEELAEGQRLLQEGRYADAVTRLDAANRLDPGNVEVMQALAAAQKKRDEAERSQKAQAELAEARRLLVARQLADARARATQALAVDPGNVEGRRLLDEINRQLVATPTPPASPTAPPASPSVPPKAPPANREKLREGVREFYAGRYDAALTKLAAAETELSSLPAYHLYLGASYLSKYLLAGEKDAALKASAVGAFKKARLLDPAFQPDPRVLSPRIVEAYQSAQ